MKNITRIEKCRICGNPELVSILNLGDQCLTGVFPRTRDQALTCGPLELVKCHAPTGCGLVQLRHSYSSGEMYGENYGYRSGLNRSMVDHLEGKVAGLLRRYPLVPGDLVLDIGSNDGTLLSAYPDTIKRLGMDPTAAKFLKFYKAGIDAVPEFFSAESFRRHVGDRKAKIITSIAMFYDLERPIEFVEQIAEALDNEGVWHFEQSYMPLMLSENAYDTICHEHLEYYGLRQIQWIMDHCGMKILDVELSDVNGGSFAVTVAKRASKKIAQPDALARIEKIRAQEDAARLDTLEPYAAFKDRVFGHRDLLVKKLNELAAGGAKIFGYGASTKGNVILQFCGITPDRIPFIAEVNDQKFGSFTPGSNIPIIAEADAHAMMPDYLLVMPWHFRKNLVMRENEYLKRGGKMIFPLPQIEIVGAE